MLASIRSVLMPFTKEGEVLLALPLLMLSYVSFVMHDRTAWDAFVNLEKCMYACSRAGS